MKTVTQRNRILAALKRGERLTPIKALNKFGCFRLGARILELRQAGYSIVTQMVKAGDARVARYRLVR